jgi:AcrR family transcriptional regulator
MEATNKDGQALGRKGTESRTRLLEAARALIAETPSIKLTATAIARAAGLASQTFYLYFSGVEELLLELSRAASEDMGEIAAELDGDWDPAAMRVHAGRVVSAFYRYWDRHRAILHIRNFHADSGNEPFVDVRNAASLPIVQKIAARIRAGQGDDRLAEQDALARAVIIFSAIERMAARYARIPRWQSAISSETLQRAEADILALLFSPRQGD